MKADEDPDRLSHVHAIRVIRRQLPLVAAILARHSKAFPQAVLPEILEAGVKSSRGQRKPRGVKCKMSNYPLRRVGIEFEKCSKIFLFLGDLAEFVVM